MHICDRFKDLGYYCCSGLLRQWAILLQMLVKVPIVDLFHNNIKVMLIFETIDVLYNILVTQHAVNLHFVSDSVKNTVLIQLFLVHKLNRYLFTCRTMSSRVYLCKATTT